MFEQLRNRLLRLLRVPPEPEPPFGNPAMLRVFRASRRLYLLRLIGWGVGQAAALAGILFWFSAIVFAEYEVNQTHRDTSSVSQPGRGPRQAFRNTARRVPESLFGWLWLAKGIGVVIYLGQLGLTYMAVRLDYELRWYMVTDRSLRIRSGLWTVQEITMSFANLQKVMVSQGPLQRLLGIADVRVESAGGGGAMQEVQRGHAEDMHSGVFHGVENAAEIRDLIIERLRRFRETGLGDPDEQAHPEPAPTTVAANAEVVQAARELLEEARKLRAAVTGAPKAM